METNTERPSGRLLYAASESSADMLYACGMMIPDPFLWYEVPGECGIVVSALEVGRAHKQVREGVRVLSIGQAAAEWQVPKGRRATVDLVRGLAKKAGVRHWGVPADFPYGLAVQLRRSRMVLNPAAEFFPERAVKSPAEVELVREGVQLAEAGLARAVDVLRESVVRDGLVVWRGETLLAEVLRGEVDAEISRLGGIAAHTITAPGVQGADCHACGTGPIAAGEPIVLDIFPRVGHTGYYGDLTRTVVKGRASDEVKRAYKAVRDAQRKAILAVRPGVSGRDVHQVAVDAIAAAGFQTDAAAVPPHGFFHGTGHGLGLEVHEAPRFSTGCEQGMVVGNVLTVEPGVYYPEWGGVRLEDVVAVCEGGCRNLTTAPFELEIE